MEPEHLLLMAWGHAYPCHTASASCCYLPDHVSYAACPYCDISTMSNTQLLPTEGNGYMVHMPGSQLTVASCSDDCLCKIQFTQEVHTAVRPLRAVSYLTAVVLTTSPASRRLSPPADQETPAMSCLCHRLQSQCEQEDSQKLLKGKQNKRKLFPFLCVFTGKKVTARYGPFSEVSQPAMCQPCWGTKGKSL